MTDNEELYERAGFGQAVDAFWNSQVGNYLRNRALECYNSAIAELKSCDPTDSKRVMRLQGEIWQAENFDHWLSEALLDGIKALDLLENPEGNE